MLKRLSTPFIGFLQASGLVSYIILITTFLTNISKTLNGVAAEAIAPVMMILLFVISAVISASMVLGRAGMLFWERNYSESFKLLFWTIGWGVMYFIIIIVILYITG